MIKIYGMPTCPYCDYVHEQIKGRENEFEYINIGENIRNMSAFTRLRDTSPVFDHCKETGNVGIPAFVFEDGKVSIDPADAGLIEYGAPDACSIEDHKSGRKNYSFSTYDSHSELCEAIRLIKGIHKPGWGYFLRAESFYNVATAEDEYSKYGGRPQHFHEKSHGESFLAMAQNNFKGNGIYLLDEPEAALSPQRQLTLLLEIVRCANDMSQFIIVTHSPILLGIPGAEILSFDDGEIHPCTYEETDSYQVTEMFINNREQILKRLLEN